MNAAADRRNWMRTLMVYIAASAPTGVMVVPDGDDSAPPVSQAQWVRVTTQDVSATGAGIRNATADRLADRRILVTLDCFARGTQLDGSTSIDAIEGLAGTMAHALTNASLPLKDYVADPTGATTIANAPIRVVTPATVRTLPPIAGIQRRQVLATATILHEV